MNKSEAFEQYWASLGMQDTVLAVTMRLIAEDVWAAATAAERQACANILTRKITCLAAVGIENYTESEIAAWAYKMADAMLAERVKE